MTNTLIQVADAVYESAVAALNSNSSRVAEIREQISHLNAQKALDVSEGRATEDFKMGFELLWHRWIDARIEKLNVELARELSERPRLIAQARSSFGKAQVMRSVATVARQRIEKRNERKQHYES